MSRSASHQRDFPRGRRGCRCSPAGWLSDRLGLNGRALLMLLGLSGYGGGAAGAHAACTRDPPDAVFPVVTIGVMAFCLLGPYSYLGGAFALDFGGKQASAASSGHHRWHGLSRRCARRRHRGARRGALRLGGRIRRTGGDQRRRCRVRRLSVRSRTVVQPRATHEWPCRSCGTSACGAPRHSRSNGRTGA